MSQSDHHHSSFIIHNASLVRVYHWRGGRPRVLDLTAEQNGWTICLVLTREGDCRLFPVAWLYEEPDPCDDDPFRPPYPIAEGALDAETLALTKAELESDGWQVTGRLDLHFGGRHTDPRFWQKLQPYLDRPRPGTDSHPGAKDGA